MLNKDLGKGDFFTVKEWVSHRDNSYKGDVLEAIVVDFPFVRVQRHGPPGSYRRSKFTLNLDQVNIKSLSQEFVDDAMAAYYAEDLEKAEKQAGIPIAVDGNA